MTQIPAKPINELEKKTGVSDQDSILILDASTGEAKLADKEELRGIGIANIEKSKSGKTTTLTLHTTDGQNYQIQLEDGEDGNDGEDGLTPQFSLEGTVFKWKFPNEESWKNLFDIQNFKGEPGVSITAITKSKIGRTTTITIHKSDRSHQSFTVEDGVGIENISAATSGSMHTITIHKTDGSTHQFTISDGSDGEDGADGKNPEFQATDTHIQRRLQGEEKRMNLIPLSIIQGIQGPQGIQGNKGDQGGPGKNPEFNLGATHIQRRLQGESQRKNLIPLEAIRGPAGAGSGDMLKANNLSDLTNKAQARSNLEVYSKSESNDLFNTSKLIEVNVATDWNQQHKVGTTAQGHYVPKKGDQLLVNFVNGTQINQPTLNIDGSGAKHIRAGYYNVGTNMLNLNKTPNSNIKIQLRYDGEYYQMFGAGHNSGYSEIPEAEITNTTLATGRLVSGRRLVKIKEHFERNVPTPTAPSHSANKQYIDDKLTKKADLVDNKIPASQLPSYVDDVLEFNTRQAFPASGEKGKIYIAINDDSQWRWTGTGYKKMVSSPGSTDAIPEGSQHLYFTNERAQSALASALGGKADKNHSHTKADIGLGKVDNTSDAEKNSATATLTNKTISGDNNTITKVNSLKNLNGNGELKIRIGTTATIPSQQETGVIYLGFEA